MSFTKANPNKRILLDYEEPKLGLGGLGSSLTDTDVIQEESFLSKIGRSTCLSLYNLNPEINEEVICRSFAVYGPIAHVSINRQSTAHLLSGVIAFMSRKDAESAFLNLNGSSLSGNPVKLDWALPMNLPKRPIYSDFISFSITRT